MTDKFKDQDSMLPAATDDKKKAIVAKTGGKTQIIINPPEKVDPQRGYQERFKHALEKHSVIIEKKTELVLQSKAARAEIPQETLEQVFKRGYKTLPLNSQLTREQYAMNRVNSFVAGGAAMVEDYDLLPIVERVRATVGMKGTGGAARPHIKREKSVYNGKTLFHVVDAKGHIKHSTNDEFEAKKHLATKYNSYMESTISPMKRFEGTKSLVKTYKDDTPGEGKKEVAEEKTNHWHDAGVKDATRGARPNPRSIQYKFKANHPDEVYHYMNGYKSVKQGVAEGEVVQFPQKHPWYAAKTCPKCEGSLVGGKTAEGRVKYCMGCGTVYPEPNTNKGVAEGEEDPQSVIKSKQKYADMTAQEFHTAHQNKSEEELKSMAWRHGYGKGSSHYVAKHKKGQSTMAEAKDPSEYDKEGEMAKGQLRTIIANAQRAHDMLEDDTNMAEWVQSKITLASDYISTVADYIQSELKEGKTTKLKGKQGKLDKNSNGHLDKEDFKLLRQEEVKKGLYYYVNRRKKLGISRDKDHPKAPEPQDWKDAAKTAKEEVDLSELNKDTLHSYFNKADKQIDAKHKVLGPQIKAGDTKAANKTSAIIGKRMTGMDRAETRLNKEEVSLSELSNAVLARYKAKAGEQASAADKAGDFKKGNKRFSGIIKATNKQFDNDAKGNK